MAPGRPRIADGPRCCAVPERRRGRRAGAGAAHRRAVLEVVRRPGCCRPWPERRQSQNVAQEDQLLDFQIPRITSESVAHNRGTFTRSSRSIGVSAHVRQRARRVLLSSLAGAARAATVRIEGVAHEFSTLAGTKRGRDRHHPQPQGHRLPDALRARRGPGLAGQRKPGKVVAADIDVPAELEILNPDHYIASLSGKRRDRDVHDHRSRHRLRVGRRQQGARDQPSASCRSTPSSARSSACPMSSRGPRGTEDRLRQAHRRHRDQRRDHARRGAAPGRRDPRRSSADLHRPRSSAGPRRVSHRGRRRRDGRRHGRRPDRGARAGRAVVQLSQARGHPDGGRPRLEVRGGAANIPNFGKKWIDEVNEKLAERGLSLRGED